MEMRRFRLAGVRPCCGDSVTKLAGGRTCGILHQDKKISILGVSYVRYWSHDKPNKQSKRTTRVIKGTRRIHVIKVFLKR